MADTKDILLKIGVVTDIDKIEAVGNVLDDVLGTYEDNVKLLAQYNLTLKETSTEMKALLQAQEKQGKLNDAQKARYAELIKQEREIKQGKSELQIVMKNQEKTMQAENGSMRQQSLILGQLRMAYRQLSDEQKAAMPEFKKFIDDLDKGLKGADAEIGNFQRNVGNYPKLIQQVASQIPGLNGVVGAFSSISGAATVAAGVVGAVGAAFMAVKATADAYNSAISGSAGLTYQLRDAMVEAEASGDVITRRLQATSGWFIKIKGGLASLWGWIKKNIFFGIEVYFTSFNEFFSRLADGKIKEAFAAFVEVPKMLSAEYQSAQQEIEGLLEKINAKQRQLDKLRESNVLKIKKLEHEASEELLKTRDKEKYSDEERLAAARKYEELTKEKFALLRKEAELERDIAILEGERTDNTHEVNMAIEESKAKLYELGVQENQALKSTAEVRGTISKSLEKEASAAEKAKKATLSFVDEAYKAIDDFVAEAENEVLPQLEQVTEKKKSPLAKMLNISDEELTSLKAQAEQAAQQIFSSIQQIAQDATQRRLENDLKAVEDEAESEKAILKGKLAKNLITEKQYEKKLAEIDADAEAKREELNKEAFEKQKRWNIAQALMNGALALTKLFTEATVINPVTWIAAGITIATTAAQIAAIGAQKYARGGELHGASHAQGGIKGNVQGHNIELEGEEVVINKRSARKYRNALSWINSDNGWGVDFAGVRGNGGYTPQLKFARGGVLGSFDFSPSATPTSSSVQQAMVKQANRFEEVISAINRRIDRLQVQVNISDIDSAHDTKQVHISRAAL
mgnify:CR=1 FL=1